MRKKTHSLTLLEVVIALTLAAILLTVLLQFFAQSNKQHIRVQEIKKTVLPIELMRQRLIHLISCLATPSIEKGEEDLQFYTQTSSIAQGDALFFSCDYEIDPDPAFCLKTQEMLYLNLEGQLCLLSWGKEDASRQEVFLEGIKSLSFSFFDPKKKTWTRRWDKKSPLPSLFKMIWATKDMPKKPQECAFFFSTSDTPIIYKKQ